MNLRYIAFFVLLSLLASCAGTGAYRRGKEQSEQGNWSGAIDSFSEAVKKYPENAQYSIALKNAKEMAVNTLLAEAASYTERQPQKAVEVFQKVLTLSPLNQKAIDGITSIEKAQAIKKLFDEAKRAASSGREQEAKAKFNKVLSMEPTNVGARNALRELDEKLGKPHGMVSLDLNFRKKISLVFRDTTLRVVLDALSENNNINFITDKDLRQDTKVSVFLREVPFQEALDQIMSSNGLDYKIVNKNTILIYQNIPIKVRDYKDLMIRNFFIANADVKQLTAMLKTVLKVKDIYTDEKRNIIVIRDTAEVLKVAEMLIAAEDQPEPEVLLEVEILEFDHTLGDSIGAQFTPQVTFGVANPITLSALNGVGQNSINVGGLGTALTLNLQKQIGLIHILANPRIRVRNKEKAKFHIGDKVPVITATTYPGSLTGATTSSVSYLDVGIKLEFEPSVQLDDDVIIKTSLEVSSITNTITNGGTTAYQVGTRNAATTLTLRDNETQVLAGLLNTDNESTTNELPGLSDIPLLGNIFSNKANKNSRKEILLSITPRIVHNLHRPTDDLIEVNSGPDAGRQTSNGQPTPIPAYNPPPPPQNTANRPAGVSGSSITPISGASFSTLTTPMGGSATTSSFSSSTTDSFSSPGGSTAGTPASSSSSGSGSASTPPTPAPLFETPPGVGSVTRPPTPGN